MMKEQETRTKCVIVKLLIFANIFATLETVFKESRHV